MKRWFGVLCAVAILVAAWALVASRFSAGRAELLAPRLNEAVRHGNRAEVGRLLAKGADPDSRDPHGFQGMPSYGVGYRPLHWAAHNGSTHMVDLLVDAGADVDCRNDYDETPLHVAAAYTHAGTTRTLTHRGADPNARDDEGHTPLHVAAREGQLPIAEVLKANGGLGLPSDSPKPGRSLFSERGRQGKKETVQGLIDAGANVNAQNDRGWTPLREAVEGNIIYIY